MNDPSKTGPDGSAEDHNTARYVLERFENARQLWADPATRERLLGHWLDAHHPHRARFLENRESIEEILSSGLPADELRRFLHGKGVDFDQLAAKIPEVTDETILSDRDLHTMQDQFSVSRPNRHADRDQRLKSSIESEIEMMRKRRHGLRGE